MAKPVIFYDETLARAAPWSLCLRCRLRDGCHVKAELADIERRYGTKSLISECPFWIEDGNPTAAKTEVATSGLRCVE